MLTKTGNDQIPALADSSSGRPLIVHVVRQFLPNRGGLEDVVYNLCQAGLKKGYGIRIVTLDRLFSDPDRSLPARETIDGIEVIRIGWKGSSRYPLAPGVLGHIGDADLVHVHAIDFFFDYLALMKPVHRKPMLVTTHGGFFHTRKFAAIKAMWFKTLTRFSAARYRHVVGCSLSDTETFGMIAPGRVTTIENGADTEKFRHAASPIPVRRMVTIGRFSVNKRLDRLIEAMAVLVGRDPGWQLDIIGVPSDHSEADIARMIEARGLARNVHLHVGLANPDIAALIDLASIMASASEYEGFGLVAIEAMSAGLLPVVEANSAYLALASHHPLMITTDFSRPEAAADAILAAYRSLETDDGSIRRTLIDDARSYAWDAVAERYFRLYRDILDR